MKVKDVERQEQQRSEGKCRGKMSMLTCAFTDYISWRELN